MEEERGPLARWLGDPVRVRRPAALAGYGLAALSGATFYLIGSGWPALCYGLTWLAMPFVAGVLGYAMAFFIGHGRGVRRAVVEMVLGALAALLSCIILSLMDTDPDRVLYRVLAAVVAAALLLAVLRGLAAGLGLALGRGLDYAGRRIQELDDEGW
jgi:hypothetical protein